MSLDRTPEEQRVLDDIARQQAAGGDPFGDEEELGAPSIADAAAHAAAGQQEGAATTDADDLDDEPGDDPAKTAAATEKPSGGEPDKPAGEGAPAAEQQPGEDAQPAAQAGAEMDAEDLADIADPLRLNQPTRFTAEAPKDFKEQRTKLLTERAQATKKLMDGEIDADQFAAEDMRIADELDTLTRQQVRAETLHELNEQNSAAYAQQALNALIRRTKTDVDYRATPAAAQQFDRALKVLLDDPEYAGKDMAEVYDAAHDMVCVMRGVQRKAAGAPAAAPAAAPASQEAPDRRPKEEVPTTLRNLPAAGSSNTGGGVEETMSRLSGPAYEAAFSRLTPAQRANLLDEA